MADVEIPQEVLEAVERGEDASEVGAEAARVQDGDLAEQAYASNLDEAEGLEKALPDAPDEDEEELEDESAEQLPDREALSLVELEGPLGGPLGPPPLAE